MKKPVFVWMCLALAPALCAQQATPRPTPPAGPLIKKAPEFAQWTVTARTQAESEGPSSPAGPPKPGHAAVAVHRRKAVSNPTNQTTSVIKTQDIRFEQTTTDAGTKIQRWCFPDMQVTIRETGTPVVSLPGNANDTNYTDYSRTDFGGFEWISPRNFAGTEKVLDQECLVFKDTMKTESKGDPSEPPPVMLAYINAATRLPVQLQVDDDISTYEFGLAPSALLAVPPDVQTVIAKWRETMRQSSLMPAKP